MNDKDELRRAIKRAGVKEVAAAFGVSESSIHKWGESGDHHRKNPMEDFLKLMEALKWDEEFMRYLCGLGGGCFVKDPPLRDGKSQDLMTVENVMLEKFGSLMNTIGKSAHKNSISTPEADDIRKHWDDMKSVTEGLVVGCENGNFDAYHAHAAKLQAKQNTKAIESHPVSANPSSSLRV